MSKGIIQFPGLNGVRCIAALMVVFCHIEQFKQKSHLPSLANWPLASTLIAHIGHQGVLVFFALSGFLITYLLLTEKEVSGKIHVRKFYIRRILRIWPLYFLIVVIGFFVVPNVYSPEYFPVRVTPNFWEKLVLCIFFLPNLLTYHYGSIFAISMLWSIGAEEQFYLIWPNLIKGISAAKLLPVLLGFLGCIVLIKYGCWYITVNPFDQRLQKWANTVYLILEFDAMIIGAICALLLKMKPLAISKFFSTGAQITSLAAVLGLLWQFPLLGPLTNVVFCSFYGILILNIVANPNTFMKLTHPVMEFLGRISYGIYLYHTMLVALAIYIVKAYISNELAGLIFIYLSVLGCTVLISSLSYKYLELPILKQKMKFMIVKSGSA